MTLDGLKQKWPVSEAARLPLTVPLPLPAVFQICNNKGSYAGLGAAICTVGAFSNWSFSSLAPVGLRKLKFNHSGRPFKSEVAE